MHSWTTTDYADGNVDDDAANVVTEEEETTGQGMQAEFFHLKDHVPHLQQHFHSHTYAPLDVNSRMEFLCHKYLSHQHRVVSSHFMHCILSYSSKAMFPSRLSVTRGWSRVWLPLELTWPVLEIVLRSLTLVHKRLTTWLTQWRRLEGVDLVLPERNFRLELLREWIAALIFK